MTRAYQFYCDFINQNSYFQIRIIIANQNLNYNKNKINLRNIPID